MRNLIMFALLLLSVSVSGQTVRIVETEKKEWTPWYHEDDPVVDSIQIEGELFPIKKAVQSSNQTLYIPSYGRNYYACPLFDFHPTMRDENGNRIRTTSSGKMAVYYIKSNGYPHYRSYKIEVVEDQ